MLTLLRSAVMAALLAAPLFAAPDYISSTTPRKVLFIGNSYTYTNNGGPFEFTHLAAAAPQPDTITSSSSMIGGGKLSEHWVGAAPGKIREGGWDVVVLQENSSSYTMVDSFFYYSRLFHTLIDSIGAQTAFFMTWERQGASTLPQIKAGYDSIGRELGAVVIPVGLAFDYVKTNRPDMNLYSADGSHPNPLGTYLEGLMFYTSLTRKNPQGNPYRTTVSIGVDSTEESAYAQGVAWDVLHNYIVGTCASPDAPSVPTGLLGEPKSFSTSRLTWNASTHPACGVRFYRVRRNNVVIGTSYTTAYTDQKLTGGVTYGYTVAAVSWNNIESTQSAQVLVATAEDTVGPLLTEARPTRDSIKVELVFSEQLDPASAGTAANYTINGVTVISAVPSGSEVALTTSPMTAFTTYTVTVTGVKDNSARKNPIAAGTQAQYLYAPPFRDNAIGYWPFDNSLDDLADTGDGTWSGTASYSDSGKAGQCLSLRGDSTGPFVSMARNPAYNGMANLSVSVWCKKAHADTGGQVILKYLSYSLSLSGTNVSGYVGLDSAVNFNQSVTTLINNTAWHHYCIVYNGTAVKVYIDAREVFSRVRAGGPVRIDNTRNLTVGKYPWGTKRTFKGLIDELKIYTTAMDSMTVVNVFNNNTPAQGLADSIAVRVLLDRNAVGATVNQVTRRDAVSGRVLGLYVDNLGFDRFTAAVGQLTAMTSLRCAGGSNGRLIIIDQAIGNCAKLETLLLNDNNLDSLPVTITALTSLKVLDVGHNKLCGLSAPLVAWLNTYDPDWQSTQDCSVGMIPLNIRLQNSHMAGATVSIYTISGQRIGAGVTDAQGFVSTDVTGGLKTGIYLFKVEDTDRVEKRLIVR